MDLVFTKPEIVNEMKCMTPTGKNDQILFEPEVSTTERNDNWEKLSLSRLELKEDATTERNEKPRRANI